MFTAEDRGRVRQHVLDMARDDARIVAGAEVGGMALGGGDRWSDIDLTFGVAKDVSIAEVLADWTERLHRERDAVHLFDQPFRSSIYRVFLFPGNLQVDLSFTPAEEFGAFGPQFALLFGNAVHKPHVSPPAPRHLFGLAVHHAVRAHISIERGRHWQAVHWIEALRNEAIARASVLAGLPSANGRGVDQLPNDIREALPATLVRRVDGDELRRALAAAVDLLLANADDVRDVANALTPSLRELGSR